MLQAASPQRSDSGFEGHPALNKFLAPRIQQPLRSPVREIAWLGELSSR
jgi:hypothetical protein